MRIGKNTKSNKAHAKRLSKYAPRHIRLGAWLHERKIKMRLAYAGLALLMGLSIFSQVMTTLLVDRNYKLSPQARAVIGKESSLFGGLLEFDPKTRAYEYNPGFTPNTSAANGQSARPKFSASFSRIPEDGVRVDDPVSETSITFKPKFALAPPKQVENRLLYPIKGQNAVKVYTLQSAGFKEDIVLNSSSKDSAEFTYELELADGTEARLEADGSVGIYGATQELLGNVSTGSDKDAQLLQKARQNAKKTTLLYTIPAPFVKEHNDKHSEVKAWFSLKHNELTVHAENLKNASYPLSIDPSVYVETAAKLMRGNNESNIDFDVNNELIQKGSTTGARFDEFTTGTNTLNEGRWNHGTAVAGGYVYAVGGSNGGTNQSSVYWAKFDPQNYDIDSANPGSGTCTNWCTNSVYDLPHSLVGFSLVAYNGFLYAIGGSDTSCTSGNGTGDTGICATVYVAKLGANGEPSLWHPDDTDKGNWDYWYRAGDLNAEREYSSAVAYNNRLYLLGGRTYDGGATAVTTVEKADILPTGDLGSWSSTGMTALSPARFMHTSQVYNDYLYVIGGNDGSTLLDSIHYIKLKSDGTMGSSWTTAANTFSTARQSLGGSFTAIWGAYLYVSGGCTTVSGSGCSTIAGDTQLASINADGSIANWSTVSGVTNSRIGYGFVSWRNTLYAIGGCTAHNTGTGNCDTTSTAVNYAQINEDGDVSSVYTTTSSGSGTCTGADPYGCDLPTAGDDSGEIGQMLSATAIMNGYMYVIGGCGDVSTTTECNAGDGLSSNTAYAAINSDGTLHRPPSCVGTYSGSWCVDNVNAINGADGIGAAGVTIFEGRLYVIGGLDNTASGAGAVFSITVEADGSLSGSWVEQTFTNLNITGELAYSFAYARANPSSAATYPGNIYIFGGCGDIGTGVGCAGSYRTEVYKCNIESGGLLEETDGSDCTTTGQLQIDAETDGEPADDDSNQGLGLHSGAVYANYIYLIGGQSTNVSNRDTVIYAKFDNSNNVVDAVSGSANPADDDDDWIKSASTLNTGREWGSSYGYNGYLYAIGGYSGSSAIDSVEFAKFDVSTGDIEAFQESNTTLNARWGQSLVVSNSYAYLIGGCDSGTGAPAGCTGMAASLQRVQIYNNDSGAPADYVSATGGSLMGTDRFGASAAVHNGYIYIAGGCVGVSDCDEATETVEYALLGDNGSIGTWATTASFAEERVFGQLEVAGGTLYYIGGQNDSGTVQSTVYYATPALNGTISSWASADEGLPAARSHIGATVWNDRIYVTGGDGTGSGCTGLNTCDNVYISPALSSGGNITSAWTTSGSSLNVARQYHTTIAYANNLYVLGGYTGTVPLSDVQFTQINNDGSLDSWTYTTSLPQRIRGADGFAANGYIYMFGGKLEDTSCNNNTFIAPISANTTIATGNNPTGVGEWFMTNERFTGERAGVTAVYNEGKAYVLGGACGVVGSTGTSTVMEDDFDATTDASMWTSTANMANGTSCGTIGTGNSLYSTGNNNAIAETKDVDVLYGGTLTFRLRIPTSGGSPCRAPDSSNEDVELQYSKNAGSSWSTITTYENTAYNTATLVTENLPAASLSSTTRFRFYMPNADNNRDQWAIDDVRIDANTVPPLTEILEDDFDATIDAADWISYSGMNVGTTCGTIGSGNNLSSSGGTSSAITTDLDVRSGAVVYFKIRVPANSSGGCTQPSDPVELQYSTNSGSSWTTIGSYDKATYDPAGSVGAVIPAGAQSASTRFRWIMPGGSGLWAIDDISIQIFQAVLAYSGSNRVVSTTLLSQPQISKYSRMIDTDTDVFPTYWLLNGVDNSIGARWLMRYRTMHDLDTAVNPNEDCGTSATMPTMTTWGQDTNFGEVTLGSPEDYNPLNSSGGDINCARYYFMYVTVDSSQAFGFPEDVERGPTITDMTLFFTSDPSKRLRHGKTFTGGQLQPLDTPF